MYVCVSLVFTFPLLYFFCNRGLFSPQVMFHVIYCELLFVPSFLPWRVPLVSCRRPALSSASKAFCVRAFFHVTKYYDRRVTLCRCIVSRCRRCSDGLLKPGLLHDTCSSCPNTLSSKSLPACPPSVLCTSCCASSRRFFCRSPTCVVCFRCGTFFVASTPVISVEEFLSPMTTDT